MIDKRKFKSKLALAGLTQKALAAKMGVCENTITDKINGKSRLYLDEVDRMSRILGIDDPLEMIEIFFKRED